MTPLFFDFESFSGAPIQSCGAAAYVRHPSTESLLITWAYREGPVFCHDIANDGPLPFQLVMDLTNPKYTKIAANIPFDRGLLEQKHNIILPWENCMDSHTLAYSLGFSGGLGAIGEQVGLSEDKVKIKEGRRLILRFCKPQPKSHNVPRWTKQNDPEGWERFKAYGIRDTESMRELWMLLEPYNSMSPREWENWQDTQRMNERGMPIDPALVARAIKMSALRKGELKQELIELTDLDNPNSGQQLLPWLKTQGVDLPNLQAATVDNALDGGMLGTLCHDVLKKKRTIGQTAVTKWNSIQKMLCTDNTLKGMFTHMGASRTWRDASRGVNLQNLRHPPKGNMDELVRYLYYGDLGLLNMVMGEPLDFLARTVRGAITAPEGKKLVVSDLGSIESRCLGWLADCTRMNSIFAAEKDTYKDFAMELFHCEYDAVTKAQRTFSKPPVLGCFGENVLVLTDTGWERIIDISENNRLWDGEQWVTSRGVKFSGEQPVIEFLGVQATQDHPILMGTDRWSSWGEVAGGSTLLATLWASGHLSSMIDNTGLPNAHAASRLGCSQGILTPARPFLVSLVQMQESMVPKTPLRSSAYPESTMCVSLIDIMPSNHDVLTLRVRNMLTTGAEVSVACLVLQRMLCAILLLLKVGISLTSKLTELIMMETILQATCDSQTEVGKETIPELTEFSVTEGRHILLHNFGENLQVDIETRELLRGKSGLEYLQSRLSKTKTTAEVNTYDIVDAGPNARFTIYTDAGPLVVHNSGYMMGGKGLAAYGAGMGVEMTKDEAQHSVDVFRGIYPEIPKLWYWLMDAIEYVLTSGQPCSGYNLTIYKHGDFMFITLPSGRNLSYFQPIWQLWDTPIGEKMSFTYMGINRFKSAPTWERIAAHAGGVTENIIQAIARDILMDWVRRCRDLHIVARIHDEFIAVADTEVSEAVLTFVNAQAARPMDWAPGLLLKAEGFITKHYTKD